MKPVVWTACLDCGQRVTGDSIHTCSPQLKQLTDEEIKDVYFNTFNWNFSESASSPFLDFARAILRKVTEK